MTGEVTYHEGYKFLYFIRNGYLIEKTNSAIIQISKLTDQLIVLTFKEGIYTWPRTSITEALFGERLSQGTEFLIRIFQNSNPPFHTIGAFRR